jgi:protoheme IX farnesyltransferase
VLSGLVLATTFVGMVLAPGGPPSLLRATLTLAGTAAVIGAANALNCWLERDVDALMLRTRERPLPALRLRPVEALVFAVVVGAAGLSLLAATVNLLTALLAALALVSYVLLYTPLKRLTPLCTLVGAIPGAIPPAIGWVAVTGRLDLGAWVLFAVLFLWQPAHFLAISWLCREDYARAGMPMLPVLYPNGAFVGRQIVLYVATLLFATLLIAPVSRAGMLTAVGGAVLGCAFVAVALPGAFSEPTETRARRTFLASILYMFSLLVLLAVDALLLGPRR